MDQYRGVGIRGPIVLIEGRSATTSVIVKSRLDTGAAEAATPADPRLVADILVKA